MKKRLLYFMAVLFILMQTPTYVFSKTNSLSNPVRIAIHKYKTGNYTGCLQDCLNIVFHDPSNAVAYYYLAMSYAQAGEKDNAVKAYSKVLSLAPNAKLTMYAATGKRCLETPDKCNDDGGTTDPELDKFISKPDIMVSDKVKQGFDERAMKNLKNDINNGKDIDDYELKKFNQHSEAQTDNKIAQNKPTDAQIVEALKVLNAAGLNPYAQPQLQVQPNPAVNNIPPTAAYISPQQNPDMAQLNMLMGAGNQSNNNNAMMNMLPYMMMQNKDGTNNYSPQMMQAVIMNSMMPNLNIDTDKDNK